MQSENFILHWKEMNSVINKILQTSSTELLLSRYHKTSKKTVKIGGFQCSVYIFPGHDDCF